MTSADLNIILPEILLALGAMAGLMAGVYGGKDRAANVICVAMAGLMAVLAAFIGLTGSGNNVAFGGMFHDDGFARFAKVAILLSAAGVLVMGQDYMSRRGHE